VRIPVAFIEQGTVTAYCRARPGRHVCVVVRPVESPVMLLSHYLGTRRERWEYAPTFMDGVLYSVGPGMVQNHDPGEHATQTLTEFRVAHGCAAIVAASTSEHERSPRA
jgi:hypothetical protein